jgi:UDP-glucose 4-epimerase
MQKIIILGSTGFIGSNLSQRFEKNPHYEVVNLGSKDCNLLNIESIRNSIHFDSNTSIIFCAGIRPDKDRSDSAANSNVLMLKNFCQVMSTKPLKSFIFFSSTSVYGDTPKQNPISETCELNPSSAYAKSKVQCEAILNSQKHTLNFPVMIVRPSIVYGPGDQSLSLIGRWMREALDHKQISIERHGHDKRDFIHIQDVVNIIECLVKKPKALVLNITSGESHSIRTAVECLISHMHTGVNICNAESADEDPTDIRFDIARLRQYMQDFKPLSLNQGIKRYIKLCQMNKTK